MKASKKNLENSPRGFLSHTMSGQNSGGSIDRRMQNLSIPAIPSRFLTPVLRFDLQEREE